MGLVFFGGFSWGGILFFSPRVSYFYTRRAGLTGGGLFLFFYLVVAVICICICITTVFVLLYLYPGWLAGGVFFFLLPSFSSFLFYLQAHVDVKYIETG